MDYPLVAVTWGDAHSYQDEIETKELTHEPSTVVSYGLLVRDDAIGLSLSSEQTGPVTFRGHTFIPRSLIQQVRVLRKHGLVAKDWPRAPKRPEKAIEPPPAP